jgi:EAL domain-containing protein (putative c-di-GMP-specific phosphodiesterase class I)/GGDEF domain-containing protein
MYVTAGAVSALVALMASAGGTANERLHRAQARDAVLQRLLVVATALRSELDDLFTAASENPLGREPSARPAAWSFDGTYIRGSSDQPPALAPITRALSRVHADNGLRRTLGPFPAADGRQFVVALVPHGISNGAWSAAGISLEDLLTRTGADALLRAGIDISVEDLSLHHTLFRARASVMEDPVGLPLDVPGARWEIYGEPRLGWGTSALARWVLIALLAAASGYWTVRLLDAPRRASVNQAHLLGRIAALNATLAEALRAKEVAEAQRATIVEIDAATGLASRRAFCDVVDRELSRIRGDKGRGLATIVVLFEHAGAIATAFTHASLTEILRDAAVRLAALPVLRGKTARVSDIELATWIETAADNSAHEPVTKLIVETMSRPFSVAGLATHVPFAVGVSLTKTGNTYAEDALHQASAAAQEAFASGPATCLRFEPTARERAITRLQLETDLRRGITDGGLRLHFQPIVALDTRQVAGFEALLRWQHPLQGLLLPGRFIPIAESAHLMLELDRWILREAVMQARQWSVDLTRDFFLTVNVSPQHFARPDLVAELTQLLRDFKVSPERLRLEVTESALTTDLAGATAVAAELRALGIGICLDDFGTGYSSLNYLRLLPLDSLKVDRSFIDRMVTNTKDFGVVKAIIDLAHYLELTCIAEGVETAEQHELLQVLAPDLAQGFFYSPAIPAERAEHMLREPTQPARRAALRLSA